MKKVGFQKIISFVLVFILFFGGLIHFLGSSIVDAKLLLTPDGSLVLEPISDVESDAEKIYYSLYGNVTGVYSIKKKKKLKIEIPCYNIEGMKIHGNSLYTFTEFINGQLLGYDNLYIDKRTRSGKIVKRLAKGIGFVIKGNHIYYVSIGKVSTEEDSWESWNESAIYRMNLDGRNKKKIKTFKGKTPRLFLNHKKVYYSLLINRKHRYYSLDGSEKAKEKAIFTQEIKGYVGEYFKYYFPKKKQLIVSENNTIKVGSYKNGRWKYKKILDFKGERKIYSFSIVGDDILLHTEYPNVIVNYWPKNVLELYDLKGNFKARVDENFHLAG